MRKERFAGETKYPLRKMIKLATEAITSFSTVPLEMITLLGFLVFGCSLLVGAWVLWVAIFTEHAVPGWASTVFPLTMLGGIQLLCLGVMGAYLGKIYGEAKSRPRYFIERTLTGTPTGKEALTIDEPKSRLADSLHPAATAGVPVGKAASV
ncbi:hypothetical protein [Pseudoduganella chitinolytica]|uniref:Glycosyltransferase n=1 Tax=Pseudoduganella chitinolytica TaxID=34070 RepID=A0ABY8BJS2_9BURK|nr:hypothetical protein [Pseudoduganella chitinolytica]WEF35658.1 hypothetical protein PX653_13205 [Pseudoduganella chitinolytica]